MAYRDLEIDPPDGPDLDTRNVVIGELRDSTVERAAAGGASRVVCWQGAVVGDGRPPRPYFVALYCDGTGSCSCPDFHFRGVLRDARHYACKHIRRARAQQPTSST